MSGIGPFDFTTAGRIRFGRGVANDAAALALPFGRRILLVRGSSVAWVDELASQLRAQGATVTEYRAAGEPDIAGVTAATAAGRGAAVDAVVGVGGGAILDLAKAAAALIPSQGHIMDHLEVVGQGRALTTDPLPMVAIPTTAGTGAEVTKNAVIAVPDAARKVSLRDDRMLPRLALVDPALTDNAPRAVTLGSGLDALVQVIEPFLSSRANLLTDAICRAAIPMGIAALRQLESGEDSDARDAMAYVSLSGGLALANAGLGAVHGLAGVVGGRFGAPHGLICGRLLGPVLAANHVGMGPSARMDAVLDWLATGFGLPRADVFAALDARIDAWGLDRLGRWIGSDADLTAVAQEAQASSSMRANPCILPVTTLEACLRVAL
tara:strand:- start:9981 stop:11123 length:1143 start_codon:yes stop_codon:yes gene_type:complete